MDGRLRGFRSYLQATAWFERRQGPLQEKLASAIEAKALKVDNRLR